MESGQPSSSDLMDRQQRAIAELASRFRNMVELGTQPVPDGAPREVAAGICYQMKLESEALVRAAEDLLRLTRELKELWLFGPLRKIGEGEEDAPMEPDANSVEAMVQDLLVKNIELQAAMEKKVAKK